MNWAAYISIALSLIFPTVLFMSGVMLVKAPAAFAINPRFSNAARGKTLMVAGGAALAGGLFALYLHEQAAFLMQQSLTNY